MSTRQSTHEAKEYELACVGIISHRAQRGRMTERFLMTRQSTHEAKKQELQNPTYFSGFSHTIYTKSERAGVSLC